MISHFDPLPKRGGGTLFMILNVNALDITEDHGQCLKDYLPDK